MKQEQIKHEAQCDIDSAQRGRESIIDKLSSENLEDDSLEVALDIDDKTIHSKITLLKCLITGAQLEIEARRILLKVEQA